MDVKGPLAGRLYADAANATKPGKPQLPAQGGDNSFGQALHDSAVETLKAVQGAEATVKSGLAGRADAHSVVEALAQTELAVETATTVRDKVVEAYNEILRMPV